MVVGEIGEELGIPSSTLSHHLEKLKNEDLVSVRREGTYLWHSANTEALQELLGFLYAECCARNKAVQPGRLSGVSFPNESLCLCSLCGTGSEMGSGRPGPKDE
jgi:hypothetical protein